MCILVVAVGCHPLLPFVCAHNRDEQRARPSTADAFEPESHIICGRDLLEGGTVMGLHSDFGHLAALTNCRTHLKKEAASTTSRGVLVQHLLEGGPEKAVSFIEGHVLNGFHVVCGQVFGESPRLWYHWVAPAEDAAGNLVEWKTKSKELGKGVFAVSNENPACPERDAWRKVEWLRTAVEDFVRSLPSEPHIVDVHTGLAQIMSDVEVTDSRPPDQLPRLFAKEKEVQLHRGVFIPWCSTGHLHDYGTVSQRIVISDRRAQQLHYFHREVMAPEGGTSATTDLPPDWSPWASVLVPWVGAGTGARARSRSRSRRTSGSTECDDEKSQ